MGGNGNCKVVNYFVTFGWKLSRIIPNGSDLRESRIIYLNYLKI